MLSTSSVHLHAGRANARWSASWKPPRPRVGPNVDPPSTTSGIALSVATCIGVTAFVMPGPEPTTHTPGLRLTQPHAEAINPADTSCRQFTTVRPSSTAPERISIIGPATTPNTASIPAALSWRAPSWPPLRSVMAVSSSGIRGSGGYFSTRNRSL